MNKQLLKETICLLKEAKLEHCSNEDGMSAVLSQAIKNLEDIQDYDDSGKAIIVLSILGKVFRCQPWRVKRRLVVRSRRRPLVAYPSCLAPEGMQRRHPKRRLAIAEALRSQQRACDDVAKRCVRRAAAAKGISRRDKRGQKGDLDVPFCILSITTHLESFPEIKEFIKSLAEL